MTRTVIVQLWSGPAVIRRLRASAAEQPAHVDQMTDDAVTANLQRFGINVMMLTMAEQRERLKAWPTQADLDAIADVWTERNRGVRPTVRVLERAGRLDRRAAGSTPR